MGTVSFGIADGDDGSEEDPFGDCEVTTTVGDLSLIGDRSQKSNDSLAVADENSRSTLARYEDPQARRERRIKAWYKEEAIHKAAVAKKLKKREVGEKKRNPGGKRKERRADKKTKAKTRRKLAKSV